MSDLYARLGIDFDQLGCVMLDCEPTTFLQLVHTGLNYGRAEGEAS